MFEDLKKETFKELKESIGIISHQIEKNNEKLNFKKKKKKNQIKILELKSTMLK